MSIQRTCVIAVCLSLLGATAPALAHDREGTYVFAGIGSANTQWKTKPGVAPAGQPRTTNTSTTSYQLGAGYRFNDYLGVETHYADMAGQAQRAGVGAVDAKALAVGVVGYLPIGNRFELFAKAGAGRTRYAFQPAAGSASTHAVRGSNSSTLLALGANYHLNSSLALRVEWSTLGVSDKALRNAIGADALATGHWTAGLNYRF